MKKLQRFITFYNVERKGNHLYIKRYGLMCTRGWWKCFKMGMRHIKNSQAILFTIGKSVPKKPQHRH